ncbi:MAG: hypothetical protein NTW21_42125 [Verrucomicrobia bacterium]|nr:hypothetical protein [Verrucomicrobiota bacterium]
MKHSIHKLLLAIAASALPFSLCPAQDATPAPQGFECPKIDQPYVHLPMSFDAPEVKLLVSIDGELQHPIDVKLAQGTPDWTGTFCVQKWLGKKTHHRPGKAAGRDGVDRQHEDVRPTHRGGRCLSGKIPPAIPLFRAARLHHGY